MKPTGGVQMDILRITETKDGVKVIAEMLLYIRELLKDIAKKLK